MRAGARISKKYAAAAQSKSIIRLIQPRKSAGPKVERTESHGVSDHRSIGYVAVRKREREMRSSSGSSSSTEEGREKKVPREGGGGG